MEQGTITFAGICGSIRKDSFNLWLLRAAAENLPEGVRMEMAPIEHLPHYNADLDLPLANERPVAVTAFRQILERAQAIVICSPEYNYSIPGVLKNAIDWASRGSDSPMLHKPVALMGATPGMWGTVRMQLAFKPVFQFLDMHAVMKPEVLVARAAEKFDAEGNLTDQTTAELIGQQLAALKQLTHKLGSRA
jgi:chromate reductase